MSSTAHQIYILTSSWPTGLHSALMVCYDDNVDWVCMIFDTRHVLIDKGLAFVRIDAA